MKKFIRNISSVILLLTSVILSMYIVDIYQTKSVSWKLPESTNVLFMGASHISFGINPEYYPNSINIAKVSERYLYTYLKLKNIINDNPQIDTLYLEFAPNDTWAGTDNKYFKEGELNEFFFKFHPFFTYREFLHFFKHAKIFITNLKLYLPSFEQRGRQLSDFGNYIEYNKIYDAENRLTRSAIQSIYFSNNYFTTNEINSKYLDLIIDICDNNNIKIIFLYMPVCHIEDYYDIDAHYTFYNDKYSHIKFLDYSNIQLPDSLRADDQHLNPAGAEVFTRRLFEDMKPYQVPEQ